jgi:hypothetical protein
MTAQLRDQFWLEGLEQGLADDFDFSQVRTTDDSRNLISLLPNADQGSAALGLYKSRVPCWATYAGEVAGSPRKGAEPALTC